LPCSDERTRTRVIVDHGGVFRVQSKFKKGVYPDNCWRDEFKLDNYPCDELPDVVLNISAIISAAIAHGYGKGASS
jgi:hypothetical protein